jgi:hypothetical protein
MTKGNWYSGYTMQLHVRIPQEGGQDTGVGGITPPNQTAGSLL